MHLVYRKCNPCLSLLCTKLAKVVVIDAPLVQRASTVVPKPIVNHPIPLNISMAPEIPSGYTARWYTAGNMGETRVNPAFNGTLPSADGPVSNFIYPSTKNALLNALAKPWFADPPLKGVVGGCSGECKAKLVRAVLQATLH